jgi:hypothetical protein
MLSRYIYMSFAINCFIEYRYCNPSCTYSTPDTTFHGSQYYKGTVVSIGTNYIDWAHLSWLVPEGRQIAVSETLYFK